MNKKHFVFFISCILLSTLKAQEITPAHPEVNNGNYNTDSLPFSRIFIPIDIDLKPVYALAEKSVDTLFTSAGYPDGWVQEGCDTRYKYVFRRSKLQMSTSGMSMQLGFTGYYKIIGSTRACANGIAISPWTPPCRCGFDEPERRVTVSFTNTLTLMTNYKIKLDIRRNEPQALDKCTVCFWGQNITNQVIKGLNAELDASKKEMEKNYGVTDMKPRMQQVWNQLNKVYDLYGMGWLQMNPKSIHISELTTRNDSLHVLLGMTAKPVISFEKPADIVSPVPHISNAIPSRNFSIIMDAVLNYDSLSRIMNQQLAGTSFDFKKAFVKKQFIIDSCRIYGGGTDKMIIRLHFSGSNSGIIYLTGTPVYDSSLRRIEVAGLDFDIKTKNILIGSAGWLFDRKITKEITKFARFDLGSYIDSARVNVDTQLNQEWIPGIQSEGHISDIRLVKMFPLQQYLVIRSACEGELRIKADAGKFAL